MGLVTQLRFHDATRHQVSNPLAARPSINGTHGPERSARDVSHSSCSDWRRRKGVEPSVRLTPDHTVLKCVGRRPLRDITCCSVRNSRLCKPTLSARCCRVMQRDGEFVCKWLATSPRPQGTALAFLPLSRRVSNAHTARLHDNELAPDLVAVGLYHFDYRVPDATACASRETNEDDASGRATVRIDQLAEVLVLCQ